MEQRAQARPYTVVEAPSILGLKPNGVEKLPQRLLELGLARRIGARAGPRVEPLPYQGTRDHETLTLNAHAIAAWSPRLADAVEAVLDRGECPLVLGGDCSILLGCMLALRRRGRFGLLFVDGHADFYQAEVNPNGEAASMELAFATGRGHALLSDLEGRRPLVRSTDVVAFGFRDLDEQRQYGSQPLPPELRAFDLQALRRLGVQRAAQDAVAHLTRPELDGFFLHVDADCLNDALMPAVEYHLPDGLSFEELETTLRVALTSDKLVGLEVTIYNPSLDRDGSAGRGLTDTLVRALTA